VRQWSGQFGLIQQARKWLISLLHQPDQCLERATGGEHSAEVIEGQYHEKRPGSPLIESNSTTQKYMYLR